MTSTGFEEFAVATTPGLLRAAALLTGDSSAAEDLVQETLTKVFVKWRRVSQVDDPVAYTRSTMTRTFISQRRKRSSGETPTDDVADASVRSTDMELRLGVEAALATLDPIDRAVLVLRFFEDRTSVQVGEDLRLSPGAVRNRTMRALQRVKPHVSALVDIPAERPERREHGHEAKETT